jgi:hypothetical protein
LHNRWCTLMNEFSNEEMILCLIYNLWFVVFVYEIATRCREFRMQYCTVPQAYILVKLVSTLGSETVLLIKLSC